VLKHSFLFLFLIFFLFADEYPKSYAQLGTPLFSAGEKLSSFTNIKTLTPEIKKYQSALLVALESGKRADTTQEREDLKRYLQELRKLQKHYDFLLHLLHQEILDAIQDQEYERFIRLTSQQLQGLLEKKAIKEPSIAFYEKHKAEQKCDVLENEIRNDALLESTAEQFYEEIVSSNFDPNDVDVSNTKKVFAYTTRVKNEIKVYFLNKNAYDVTLSIKPFYKNISVAHSLNSELVIGANTTLHYATLKLKGAKSTYGYSYQWIMGNMDAKHDDSYRYRLPYALNETYRVSQGYNGTQTHKGRSKYAIDFAMPEGSSVHAARDGVVVKVKSDSNRGGYDKKFAQFGNFVTIAHIDGTMATYYHLKQGGVVVSVGEQVSRGQKIGYSGNTGYSSGPHLHFAVFKAKNSAMTQTIAVVFSVAGLETQELLQGEAYTAK